MHLLLSQLPSATLPAGGRWDLAPRDAALLAWLALEGPTPRSRTALLLWPEKDLGAARNSLRQRLFQLRRQLGTDPVVGSTTLALAAGVTHDLDDADTVLGGVAADQLVPGEFAHWLEAQRERRRARVRRSLVELCEMAERARDWDDALAHAHELLTLEPLSEEAHRRLIRLHYVAGDRAAALLAFDHCERVLKDEVGTTPGAETLALLRTVEAADRPAAAPGPQVPASVLRPPRLIGREPQWAPLATAWQAGHCAVVTGEAGLGKTRLATDFAQAQGRTLVTGARPGDARVVYASASRLLRALPRAVLDGADTGTRRELARLLPELGDAPALAGDAERTRFFNAVAALLESSALALDGIVFDDLHFADDASVDLLQYVSSASSRRWLVCARQAEVTEAGRALLAGFAARGHVAHVELQPLTPVQIEAFVASLDIPGVDAAAVAPALARHSGGNPLFLLETLKAWLSAEPPAARAGGALRLPTARGVAQLIEQRIGRLSVQAVQLARCAAVAAPDFSIELASRVLGLRTLELADPWAELEAAQVLRDGAFAHDLIYESALASVPKPVARRLHAEIAAYLDAHGGEPARVAAHWLEAGHEPQALDALLRAAQQAQAAMRKREEIAFRERAADLAERLGRRALAFDCWCAIFDAQMIADRTALDEAFMARLDRLADTPQQQLQALLHRSDIAKSTGRYPEGAQLAEAAAELARRLGREEEEVHALRAAAGCAAWSGDPQRAVRLLRPALPWIVAHADAAEQQSFFNDLACCLDNANQSAEAQAYHRRAIDGAVRAARWDQAAIASGNLTFSLRNVGRLQAAFDNLQQARRYAMAFDDARGAGFAIDVMAFAMLRELGRYAEALGALGTTLHVAEQNPAALVAVLGHEAALWLHLGQPARAQQALAAAAARPLAPHQRARIAQLQGQLQQCLGLPAADAFGRAWAERVHLGRLAPQSMVVLDHAFTLPAAAARLACEDVARGADAAGLAGVVLAARVRGCLFAVQAGDAGAAAALARQVVETDPAIAPDDLLPAERWRNLALAFEMIGDIPQARAFAEAGCQWLQRTAAEQVPAEFREGFLHRQPVNRDLAALAARLAPR